MINPTQVLTKKIIDNAPEIDISLITFYIIKLVLHF